MADDLQIGDQVYVGASTLGIVRDAKEGDLFEVEVAQVGPQDMLLSGHRYWFRRPYIRAAGPVPGQSYAPDRFDPEA